MAPRNLLPPIFSNPKLPLLYGEIVSSGVYFKKISTPRKNFSSWDAVGQLGGDVSEFLALERSKMEVIVQVLLLFRSL